MVSFRRYKPPCNENFMFGDSRSIEVYTSLHGHDIYQQSNWYTPGYLEPARIILMSFLGYLEPVRITLMSLLVRSSQIILSSLCNKSSSHLQTEIGLNQPTNSNYSFYGFGHCLQTKLLNDILANCSDNPTKVLKIIFFYVFLPTHIISFKIRGLIFFSFFIVFYCSPRLFIFPVIYLHLRTLLRTKTFVF